MNREGTGEVKTRASIMMKKVLQNQGVPEWGQITPKKPIRRQVWGWLDWWPAKVLKVKADVLIQGL